MATFTHDGIIFHYREAGAGVPFVFQHGLGGDTEQVFDLFTPPPGIHLLTLDCRSHGATQPADGASHLSFATFAGDVIALLDHLQIARAVVGGISMGAGVALTLAKHHSARVQGLVLVRPAWLDRPLPPHLLIYPALAWLLRVYGVVEGRRRFAASGAYAQVLAASSDAAASLLGQFDAAAAVARVARLERIPLDCPLTDLDDCREWMASVLVLGNRQDPIHPFELAEHLATYFRRANFIEVTAKSVSREAHRGDVQAALAAFLAEFAGHSTATV